MGSSEFYVSPQSRGVIALPPEVRARLRLDEPGTQIRVVERDDGVLELHPTAPVPVDQAWFWTQRWQRMEREVDDHVAAGRVERFGSGEEFFDGLASE